VCKEALLTYKSDLFHHGPARLLTLLVVVYISNEEMLKMNQPTPKYNWAQLWGYFEEVRGRNKSLYLCPFP
jgi:hypothetical protein